MITFASLVMWLVQAPPIVAPPMTAPPREWNLAGVFVLKQERYLTWGPVIDLTRPFRGWDFQLQPVWTLELTPKHRRLDAFSLAAVSAPGLGSNVGLLQPKLQYRVPGTEVRIGVQATVLSFFTAALAGTRKVTRPMAFVSTRF
ncbi:hypothetical protein [Nannocystis pusilla]|uniref:hypothetical protein n=1 Tax=Nannocystis pusilla TaxID=889268 RepID=UPI003DA5E4E7